MEADIDPDRILEEQYEEASARALEILKKAESDIVEFAEVSAAEKESIAEKLSKIKALPGKGQSIIVIDPTERLFSTLKIEQMDPEAEEPVAFAITMEAPIIPHFYLALSYLYIRHGITPCIVVRTLPVVSLIGVAVRGGALASAAAAVAGSALLADKIITGEASIYPPDPSMLEMPVRSSTDKLYITPLGLSTVPTDNTYAEVDLSEIPRLSDKTLSAAKTLKELLDVWGGG